MLHDTMSLRTTPTSHSLSALAKVGTDSDGASAAGESAACAAAVNGSQRGGRSPSTREKGQGMQARCVHNGIPYEQLHKLSLESLRRHTGERSSAKNRTRTRTSTSSNIKNKKQI
jgi:hypothetical protein